MVLQRILAEACASTSPITFDFICSGFRTVVLTADTSLTTPNPTLPQVKRCFIFTDSNGVQLVN